MSEKAVPVIGFVGLGVMGGPMCRNVAQKHGGEVIAFDMNAVRVRGAGGHPGAPREYAHGRGTTQADIVFLSLPGSPAGRASLPRPAGARRPRRGRRRSSWIFRTTSVAVRASRRRAALVERHCIRRCAGRPDSRGRTARRAQHHGRRRGVSLRAHRALLRYMGSDVTRCGSVGCGQVVKLINNALVFENTVAIAEMMVLSERAGVPPAVLLDAVSKGSGDSYALRNHARKAMLPREFPEKSFPPEYVLKDMGYVLELAAQVGVSAHVTKLAQRYYTAALNHGWAGRYYPAVIEVVDRDIELPAQP